MNRLHLVAASLFFAITIRPAQASIEAQLELLNAGSSKVEVALKYTNNGANPASIRAADIPQTMPDGRLWNNAFHVVSSTGEVARYTGVIVNLTMEARSEVLTLQPGQVEMVEVNISSNYLLEPDTDYDLTPRGFEQRSLPDPRSGQSAGSRNASPVFTSSPTLRVRTGPRAVGIYNAEGLKHRSPGAACSPDKILAVAAAMSASAKLAREARDYVEGLYGLDLSPEGGNVTFNQTPRYTTWFGLHGDPNVFSTINTRIRKVLGATADRYGLLSPASCDCEGPSAEKVIAWVDPDSAHVINYCPRFFELPVGPGIELGSKARTIYHEVSHFNDFLGKGTQDYEAAFALPSQARYLARTARDVASDHAYGYEYFADNLDSQN
ncbi:TPA: hypothetical protein QDZ10_001234 [Stenotrophomonas maltophilia]|nr:hypothetical protein [Stenotrophomonas maltophilia]